MKRNAFIENKSDKTEADNELLRFKTAWSVINGLEEMKKLAEKSKKQISHFEGRISGIISGMVGVHLVMVGESDLLENTFNYNDDFSKVSFLMYQFDVKNHSKETESVWITLNVVDVLKSKAINIRLSIRKQLESQQLRR